MTASPPAPLSESVPLHSSSPLASTLNRLQPAPETVVLLLAIVIGTGTGLAVVLFHYLIEKIHSLMLEDVMGAIAAWGGWTLACVPSLGGLVVGLMRWRVQEFSPSITALIAATQQSRQVKPGQATAKAIAASVSLGTGASLGPEGPSVEIGANVGLVLGQALQVSHDRLRLLLGAGAAAGLAAGFNAPIAGVFFALEVVLGATFATSAVSLVLLAAVVSALISQIGLGGQPAFSLPAYEVRSPLELPLYLGLGLFASGVSIAYTQTIQFAQRFFRGEVVGCSQMAFVPPVLRPVIGGICVGCVALAFPQILGIGYETVEAMLSDAQIPLLLLVSLLGMKLAMTAVSLGSGLVGGLFAPAMFLGASLGAAYGKGLALVLPAHLSSEIAAPPAYAMVGMAAVLAASTRAPLTAILLLFELTRDYRIILPLMAAVGLSVWLVERLKPIGRAPSTDSATDSPTGLPPEPDPSADWLHRLCVAQAMHQNFLTLSSALPVLQAGMMLTRHQMRSALVLNDAEELTGIITLQDINRVLQSSSHLGSMARSNSDTLPNSLPSLLIQQTLSDICTQDVLFAYEDESMADAVSRMAARGLRQLPVVDRAHPKRVVGVIDQEQIDLACSLAITRESMRPYLKPTAINETVSIAITQKSA